MEAFKSGYLSDGPITRRPRWFKIGNECSIEVKEQMVIIKELTGDANIGLAGHGIRGAGEVVLSTGPGIYPSSPVDIWTCGKAFNYHSLARIKVSNEDAFSLAIWKQLRMIFR